MLRGRRMEWDGSDMNLSPLMATAGDVAGDAAADVVMGNGNAYADAVGMSLDDGNAQMAPDIEENDGHGAVVHGRDDVDGLAWVAAGRNNVLSPFSRRIQNSLFEWRNRMLIIRLF